MRKIEGHPPSARWHKYIIRTGASSAYPEYPLVQRASTDAKMELGRLSTSTYRIKPSRRVHATHRPESIARYRHCHPAHDATFDSVLPVLQVRYLCLREHARLDAGTFGGKRNLECRKVYSPTLLGIAASNAKRSEIARQFEWML